MQRYGHFMEARFKNGKFFYQQSYQHAKSLFIKYLTMLPPKMCLTSETKKGLANSVQSFMIQSL